MFDVGVRLVFTFKKIRLFHKVYVQITPGKASRLGRSSVISACAFPIKFATKLHLLLKKTALFFRLMMMIDLIISIECVRPFHRWGVVTEEVITFKSAHKKIIGKYFSHLIVFF